MTKRPIPFYICLIKTKVLFVCLGNICRSPLAEGIFNSIIAFKNTTQWFEAESAGTSNYHIGEPPDDRTLENARRHNLILKHKGRQIQQTDFYQYQYIMAMDDSNLSYILRLKPTNSEVKILKIRDFDPLEKNADVPDPWYGGEKGFENVYQILLRSCHHFYDHLIGMDFKNR